MTKIDFGNFWKFIVSIGISIALIPLLTLYILINKTVDIVIDKKSFELLTSESQEAILNYQNFAAHYMKFYIWYQVVGIVIGLIVFIYGIKNWYRKQVVEDKNQQEELNERMFKNGTLKEMSKVEEFNKVNEEIEDEQRTEGDKSVATPDEEQLKEKQEIVDDEGIDNYINDNNIEEKTIASRISSADNNLAKVNRMDSIRKYFQIEEILYENIRLLLENRKGYKVYSNLKIDNKFDADLFVIDNTTRKYDIIEIKYSKRKMPYGQMVNILKYLSSIRVNNIDNYYKSILPILVIVHPEEGYENIGPVYIENVIKYNNEHGTNIKVVAGTDNQLDKISNEIVSIILK